MSASNERGDRYGIRWTVEEDERLMKAVIKCGDSDWDTIQKNSGLDRSSKTCWTRWTKYIKPGLSKGKFTKEEEDKMRHLSSKKFKGNKWTEIAKELPGRSAYDVETFCKSLGLQDILASRTQQLVDDSQAAHNPDTTGKTSIFGKGSGPSHQFPDPDMYGKVSSMYVQASGSSQFGNPDRMVAQGSVSSQFPYPNPDSMFAQGSVSSQFPYPNPDNVFAQGSVSSRFLNTDSMFAQGSMSSQFPYLDIAGKGSSMFAQASGSSQFPSMFRNPDTTDITGRRFAQGSAASQFPSMFRNPDITDIQHVMQQCNSLNSTFISTPATGPASIDQYTGLSGNTSMNAGLPLLTGGTETHEGSSSSNNGSMLKKSISSLDKPRSPRDNGNLESIFYPAKVSEGSSDDSLLPFNTDLDDPSDLSISEEDLNRLRNILREIIEAFDEIEERKVNFEI